MDSSASAPCVVLRHEDYFIPCHGVGDTGHAKRVLNGGFSKDPGVFSSRLAQIARQANKAPGPGKYVAHTDWANNGGNKFCNQERSYKPCNKVPAPMTYERKDFMTAKSIGAKDCLSHCPRVLHGKMPTGKKRSFMDMAIAQGHKSPGPGHCIPKSVSAYGLDVNIKGAMSWQRQMQKSKNPKPPPQDLAPCHYTPNYSQTEHKLPNWTVPKETGKDFVSKAQKEKIIDLKTKREVPGPGTYPIQNFPLDKTSRGTYHLQLRGVTRNPLSGYM